MNMMELIDSLREFKFYTKPFQHQEEAFNKSAYIESFALTMEQGTGKTKVVLDTAAYLYSMYKINGLLVIAPNGVHENWAYKEIPTHFSPSIPTQILVWNSRKARTKNFRIQFKDLIEKEGLSIFLMNVETWSSKIGREVGRLFLSRRKSLMVVDESTRIKTPGAKRTQGIIAAGKLAKYRRILTGTLITQSPFDIYSQFKFLDGSIVGINNFYAFKSRYGILEQERNWGTNQTYDVVVGYQNLEELKNKISPYLFRVTKEECLDLPPKLYKELYFDMTPEQEKIYEDVKEKALVEIEEGELNVSLALVKLLRLQQVTGGIIPKVDNPQEEIDYYVIPGKNPKINALIEILEETEHKAIIWSRFISELKLIEKSIQDYFGKEKKVALIYGNIPADKRTKIINNFQDPENPLQIIVANPAVAGEGLTLTQAKTIIYFSNSFSYHQRIQSEDRAHRIGQNNKVLYIDLILKNSIDVAIKNILKDKLNMANYINQNNIRNIVNGE